jgi:hypothetical protein
MRQVHPWARWPSGDSRPLSVLPFDLPELTARYGLAFQEEIDDLGPYRFAAIALDDGQQAWLSRHGGDPNPGTVVLVDATADIEHTLALLLDVLNLERDSLLWTAPASTVARA